ncbi:MAG: HNH endonuclease [Alphaproteobacteria bacterium]|jgi:hypothetical protein
MAKAYNYVHQKHKVDRKKNRDKNRKKKPNRNTRGGGNGGNGGNGGGFNPGGTFTAEQRAGQFTFDTIHGLKLKEVEYTVPPLDVRKQGRNAFNGGRDAEGRILGGGVRSKFLQMLVEEHEKELVEKLGLTQRDLDGMREGYTPNGFNVHHKLSLHGGGKNEFSNFILTPLYPHDQWHHDVIDPQLVGIREGETRKILIPWTDEMIYDPKKYGFMKENQPVNPCYRSNVDASKYPKLYKAEHISVEQRQKDTAAFFREIDAKKAEQKKRDDNKSKKLMDSAVKDYKSRGR